MDEDDHSSSLHRVLLLTSMYFPHLDPVRKKEQGLCRSKLAFEKGMRKGEALKLGAELRVAFMERVQKRLEAKKKKEAEGVEKRERIETSIAESKFNKE